MDKVASDIQKLDDEAVNNFKEYLRIPSVHPNVNYDKCVEFLIKQAKTIDLPYKIYYCIPGKPIFVISWIGTQPTLPTIWLSSHMDVVPVYEEKWSYKPFAADMDNEGNIYARGAQDTKSLGIEYLEAIKRLRKEGVQLKRTVHVSFTSDEEINSTESMKLFAPSDDFKRFNVGFVVDETIPMPDDTLSVFYGERFIWQLKVHCTGEQGHGSLLMPHPPGNKLGVILEKFNAFRASQIKKLADNPELKIGDVTSVNLTKVEGGVQANVVPPEFIVTYDIRMPATVDEVEFEGLLNKWCKEAGEGVWIEFTNKNDKVPNTILDDSNLFWVALKNAVESLGIKLVPMISTGGTDARFIRKLGIPAVGFSGKNNTISRAHDNDEYLNVKVLLKGIEIFKKVIPALANV